MSHSIQKIQFHVSEKAGDVSGIIVLPDVVEYLYLFAHGAGAAMNHSFMEKMAGFLADQNIATFRYNFPYTEKNGKRPDHSSLLMETVKAAYQEAASRIKDIPVLAGGKSMGGRMTSMAAAKGMLKDIKGIVFFGFPLHAPGKPSDERAAHLCQVKVPMLFLQGTKDKLADLTLLKPVLEKMKNISTLYTVDGGDHSFHLPKSAGKNDEDVMKDLAKKVKEWADLA